MIKSKVLFFIFFLFTCMNAQWTTQHAPTTTGIADIYFADTSNGWITALYDGIFFSSDGGYTWEQQYTSFAANLSGLSNSELWVTGRNDTLLHTTNGGISWDKISVNNFLDLDSVQYVSNIYFFNTTNGWAYIIGWKNGFDTLKTRLLNTTNGGLTWQMKTNPYSSSSEKALIQFLDPLYGFIAGTDHVPLYKTTNGGDSWDTLATLGFWNGLMDMQFVNPNIGWATSDGPVLTTTVWRTTDGGINWEPNLSFQCSELSTYVFFTDTIKGWVVQWTCLSSATEIYHTKNGGLSWELQFTYPPFSPQKIFFVDSLHGWVISDYDGTILHTSTGGVIPVELISFTAEVTQDGIMLSWITGTETNNSGFEVKRLQYSNIEKLQEWETIGFVPGFGTTTEPKSYSFIDKDVITGTYKYHLKQIDFDGTFNLSQIIEIKVDFANKAYVLEQNFPNPFNAGTTIKYYLPEKSNINLTVYDILGNGIKVLVDEEKDAGNFDVKFNANEYPSGVYFYTLTAGNSTATKKLILLK